MSSNVMVPTSPATDTANGRCSDVDRPTVPGLYGYAMTEPQVTVMVPVRAYRTASTASAASTTTPSPTDGRDGSYASAPEWLAPVCPMVPSRLARTTENCAGTRRSSNPSTPSRTRSRSERRIGDVTRGHTRDSRRRANVVTRCLTNYGQTVGRRWPRNCNCIDRAGDDTRRRTGAKALFNEFRQNFTGGRMSASGLVTPARREREPAARPAVWGKESLSACPAVPGAGPLVCPARRTRRHPVALGATTLTCLRARLIWRAGTASLRTSASALRADRYRRCAASMRRWL